MSNLAAATIQAYATRRRKGFAGFSAFGDASNAQVRQAQSVLNGFAAGDAAILGEAVINLAVDGQDGENTSQRTSQFQRAHGIPDSGDLDDLTLRALGIAASGGLVSAVEGQKEGESWAAYLARIALLPATEAGRGLQVIGGGAQSAAAAAAAAIKTGAGVGADQTYAQMLALAKAGGAAAAAALKWLSDNGDWIAKIALALGIGYTAATMVVVGGVGVVAIILLKKK